MHSRCRKCEPVPEELRRAAELLERRWLLSVVYASLAGAERFTEFRQAVQGISPKTLSDRLAELEAAGVLRARRIPGTPPPAESRLTARGKRLARVVEAVTRWTAA